MAQDLTETPTLQLARVIVDTRHSVNRNKKLWSALSKAQRRVWVDTAQRLLDAHLISLWTEMPSDAQESGAKPRWTEPESMEPAVRQAQKEMKERDLRARGIDPEES